jgi:hypothetical protein
MEDMESGENSLHINHKKLPQAESLQLAAVFMFMSFPVNQFVDSPVSQFDDSLVSQFAGLPAYTFASLSVCQIFGWLGCRMISGSGRRSHPPMMSSSPGRG